MTEENLVQDAEFTEVNEMEEVTETTKDSRPEVDKGVLIFKLEDGSTSHSMIGEVSLENMTYFTRYLNMIEQKHWDKLMKESEEEAK